MKISVVVPVYNAGNKLKKCIKSILNQTFKEFELILINDGSTDNSLSICNNYANIDKRVRVINKQNEGCIETRRRGIQESNADYIMFVDADDWIDKKTLELLYEDSINNNSDIVVCKKYKAISNFIKKDVNGNLDIYLNKHSIYEGEDINNILTKSFLFAGCFPCEMWGKLYKKELLIDSGKYLDKIKFFGEDLYLNIEVFSKSKKVSILDEKLYYYRMGGGISKYMPYYFDDIINGYKVKRKIARELYECNIENVFINISSNLLDLYKSFLLNIMYSDFNENDIKKIIKKQVSNISLIEAINYLIDSKYDKEFIQGIKEKDIDYLYEYGLQQKKSRILKDKILNILAIFS